MISYLFVLLMMVIGGVIGFLADSWGHKIGKKRLSFMRLRPRHTATLITVGAGVVIPLVTVVIVAILSSGVREWIFLGQRAIQQAQQLGDQVEILKAQQQRVEREIRQKTALSQRLDATLKATEASLKTLTAKAETYRQEASKARADAVRLTRRVAQIRTQLVSKQHDLTAAQGDLAKKKKEFHGLEITYNEAYKQLEQANAKFLELDGKNTELQKTVKALQEHVDSLNAAKEQADAEIKAKQAALEDTKTALRKAVADFDEKIKESTDRLNETEDRLKRAQSTLDLALNGMGSARAKPLMFGIGEELARNPLGPNRSAPEVAAGLESLLRSARLFAAEQGAKATATQPAAGLFPIPTNTGVVSVADQENRIVNDLVGRNEDCVLIAYSEFNAFKGEWVPLYVQTRRNPLVYKAGNEIAETVADGRMSDADVVNAIEEFVKGKVADRAKAAGMIPIQGREGGLGSVGTHDMLVLLKEILDSGQRVRVRAEAAQATRAADPLKLKLTVRYGP